MGAVTIVAAAGPDWASIMTAIGTVAVAIVAVGIAIWSEWRTDRRLADERAHSEKQLADERALSRAQIQEERQTARNREQLTEAYAVQVVLGERSRAESPRRLGAIVINHGHYTIAGIEARLRLATGDGPTLVPFAGSERVPGTKDLDAKLRDGMSGLLEGMMHGDRLTPWDVGMRFWSDLIPTAQLPGAYPVVRWTDRWGTCWEHRRGEVEQIAEGEDWQA